MGVGKMDWLKKRVWQLGIAALLILAGALLIYTAGTGEVNETLLWVGLGVTWVALAIPLLSKAFHSQATQEQKGEEGES